MRKEWKEHNTLVFASYFIGECVAAACLQKIKARFCPRPQNMCPFPTLLKIHAMTYIKDQSSEKALAYPGQREKRQILIFTYLAHVSKKEGEL